MADKQDRAFVQDSINACFSELKGDPWLAQRILNGTQKEKKMKKKLSFGFVLAMVMILVTVVAVAAGMNWGAFEHLIGGNIQNADAVMQGDLHHETVGDVEISIKEAGYDGKTLWLTTSYRFLDVTEPYGHQEGGVPGEWYDLLNAHHVGWWMDAMWINGQDVNMPGGSYSTIDGSDVPGELLVYETWRLDHEGITLNGLTEIALPIGETQSVSDYTKAEHPELYKEDGTMKMPTKGMVVFSFTPSTINVQTAHPCIKAELPLVTAQTSEVVYSPIMTYITLDLEVNPKAMQAYVAEHGASITMTDEGNGQSFEYHYSGWDVFGDWLNSLVLVDGEGNEVFADLQSDDSFGYGSDGVTDITAEFCLPYAERWPDELYLAPMFTGKADMSLAVKVK